MMKLFIPFLLFFILANPKMFMATGRIFGAGIADSTTGRPTQVGVALHAVVYLLVTHIMWSLLFKDE